MHAITLTGDQGHTLVTREHHMGSYEAMPTADRFWSMVERKGPNDCWLWTASTQVYGYGQITVRFANRQYRNLPAHRVSYQFAHGEIPVGMCVCHTCDVPRCVNPAHLFLGTKADNNADMKRKNRHPLGDRHHNRKLNSDQVRAIRNDPRPQRTIAPEYGVSSSCISGIKIRRCWKEVV